MEPKGTTRTLKGTLRYVSPEVAKLCRLATSDGETYRSVPLSDLWSVGVTLF